jgi:hypothetical protein
MKKMYSRPAEGMNLGTIARISVAIILVMVWILIDKGNVYGQSASRLTEGSKMSTTSTHNSPSFKDGDDEQTDDELGGTDEGDVFTTFPNPVIQELVFDFEFTVKEGIPFDVHDMLGKLEMRGEFKPQIKTQKLDLSALKPGIYVVRLKLGDKMVVRKILKG